MKIKQWMCCVGTLAFLALPLSAQAATTTKAEPGSTTVVINGSGAGGGLTTYGAWYDTLWKTAATLASELGVDVDTGGGGDNTGGNSVCKINCPENGDCKVTMTNSCNGGGAGNGK